MSIIHLRRTHDEKGPGPADPPVAGPSGPAEQVLFREARRRERRRRAVALALFLALAGLVSGLVFAAGGSPPPRSGGGAGAENNPAVPGAAAGHFTFRGNGIGGVTFGQPEVFAIFELSRALGPPVGQLASVADCNVESYLTYKTLTAYFFRRRFVGYDSASLLAAPGPGVPHVIPSVSTAAGLRIGDDIAQARRIYGRAFVVLLAQGGSWRVTTSTGTLDGYLTAVPGGPAQPKVADISAGSVGCPAASP